MASKKLLYTGLILLILIAAGAVAFTYYQSHRPTGQPPASEPTTITAPTTTPTDTSATTTPTAPAPHQLSVFFSKHPESDNDPSAIFAVSRSTTDSSVGTFVINELLKGPTPAEASAGYFTTARLRSGDSNCGGPDFTLDVNDTVAILKFCRPFDHLGVVADGQAASELKASLLQFSTIKRVMILNSNGNCEFDLSGLELCKQR